MSLLNFLKKPIEVFVRHCNFSEISYKKKRIKNFSKENCFNNLMETVNPKLANVTFFLDIYYPSKTPHFLDNNNINYIRINEGNEAGAFLNMLDYVEKQKFSPDTIIYFLEDDYLHKSNWCEILLEGFTLPFDYVTLYDHKNKYFDPMYENLISKIFYTKSCHWRTTPSTTNTYAMKYKTLKKHIDIHRKFSQDRLISADHAKFTFLKKNGSTLISSIPAWSTHTDLQFQSPCVNWESIIKKYKKKLKFFGFK